MPTIVKNTAEFVVPRSILHKPGIKASSRSIANPTKAEAAAIRIGEAEIARGEVVTLTDLFNDLNYRRRKNNS